MSFAFLGLYSHNVFQQILRYSTLTSLVILLNLQVKAGDFGDPDSSRTGMSIDLKVDTILKRAYSVMGTPYKWAGATPQTGFDCSGFVYWCFQPVGVKTGRSSSTLFNMGEKVEIENAQPGDLILFKGTDPNSTGVGHVGIVVSKKGEPL